MQPINMSSPAQDLWLPGQRPRRPHKPQRNEGSVVIASSSATTPEVMSPAQVRIHRCLCLLIVSIIFEGIGRKLAPQSVGILIFFLKDFLTFVLLWLCLKTKPNAETARLLSVMRVLSCLLLPCIIVTAVNDPLLAVFGTKQYVLFAAVAVAMCTAYLPNHRREFFSLFRGIALSLFITTLVAVAQNRLPSSSWLNLSVAGDDLSNFSAGGYLRVSSTFSFVGQYCWYLNALCYSLPVFFFFNHNSRFSASKIMALVLIGLFVVGTFVTGSRTAVIGNAGILSASGCLLVVCGGFRAVSKMVVPAVIAVVLLAVTESLYPEFFAAYQARVEGTTESSHSVEVEKRIAGSLLDWTQGTVEAPPSVLGYGLGVMSNGSEKFSAYAAQWRNGGFWTEADQATTFFEGGWYLILIWYGFRIWVIFHSLRLVLNLRSLDFRLIACFAWGYIVIIGVTGTLALQPPMAVWWWLAVGVIICLGNFDRQELKPNRNAGSHL